jgi:hypothetical protein
MKFLLATCCVACGGAPATSATSPDAAGAPPGSSIYDQVDQGQLQARLGELTGLVPVTAGGSTFRITNRWAPAAKANFRAYFRQYMEQLGATVNELTFPIPNLVGETQGHNMEAVLPGKSADSVVIIVHYDTVGITGKEAQNPGADDDGSGLAMEMEAARVFAAIADRAETVRFVAADYEEISDNLDGDVAYVKYLQADAKAKGYKILVASDDDQTGWSCWSEGLCSTGSGARAKDSTFQMISCSGDTHHYDYPDLSSGIIAIAEQYSKTMLPTAVCDGSGDTDHYPFWQAGIPAYVIEEWGSENNPHYDDTGDDTMAHIDLDMLTETSRIQIAFQAKLAGI